MSIDFLIKCKGLKFLLAGKGGEMMIWINNPDKNFGLEKNSCVIRICSDKNNCPTYSCYGLYCPVNG